MLPMSASCLAPESELEDVVEALVGLSFVVSEL